MHHHNILTTVCEPGIELKVVYSRKMCFSVWWVLRGGGVVYTSMHFFFLWTVHSQPPFSGLRTESVV